MSQPLEQQKILIYALLKGIMVSNVCLEKSSVVFSLHGLEGIIVCLKKTKKNTNKQFAFFSQ